MIEKIISGGQTGVDRAALDIAIKSNIAHGGWCPKGRKAEDGVIPKQYQLQETDSDDYSERTKLNIRDTDGTLVLVTEVPITVTDGTALTIEEVNQKHKPYLVINLNEQDNLELVIQWLKKNNIHILNVGGPRESQRPGVYQLSFKFLEKLLFRIQTINI